MGKISPFYYYSPLMISYRQSLKPDKKAPAEFAGAFYRYCLLFFVIQLGLEPRTPTLKVLCSTC